MAYGRRKYRRKSYSRKRRGYGRVRRNFGRHKMHSHPSKSVRSCGQGTLTDSLEDLTAINSTTQLYSGGTTPGSTLCNTWNLIDTGNERFNKSGDRVRVTGFWMKIRINREAAEVNILNDKVRICLWKQYDTAATATTNLPNFEDPVTRAFKEHNYMLYDKIHNFFKGFAIAGVKSYRDIWIKLKLNIPWDFHGTVGDQVALDAPVKNKLRLYAILPDTPTASNSMTIEILDWKLYFQNSFA